jgi:chromate transport protein ChrA
MTLPRRPLDPEEALAGPMYAVAFLLVAFPLVDFLQSIRGFQPGNLQWRFATVGLLSGVLLTPILGVIVAMVVAAIRGHALVQRLLAILNLLAAVVLLVLLIGFVLDLLQLRSIVPEAGRAEFRSASMRAVVKHLSASLVLFFLGWRGWRVSGWTFVSREGQNPVRIVAT